MTEGEAFYELDKDHAIPSELTRGPWDAGSQRAGPPAALLGRAMETLPPGKDEMRIGRITYEILRPVPIAPLRIEAGIERDGRRVQMLQASLHAGNDEVMRARGWRLRVTHAELPSGLLPGPLEHGPADGEPGDFFPTGSDVGYHSAVEYRFVKGGFVEPGPATVWMRSRVSIIAGEEISPLGRVLVVADSGNGIRHARLAALPLHQRRPHRSPPPPSRRRVGVPGCGDDAPGRRCRPCRRRSVGRAGTNRQSGSNPLGG